MRYCGEDRDVLIQKKVNLVQEGEFVNNISDMDAKSIMGIDSIIHLNYMGSSEFEFGSLPRSLRRMTLNKDFYKMYVFNKYKDDMGNHLKVYAPEVYFKNTKAIVDRLVMSGEGLQEYCSLCDHIKKGKPKKDSMFDCIDNSNFWWDIENDFFMFFENTDKVLMAMDALKKRKFGYDRNIPQRAFSKFYLEVISKININPYFNWNSSIKNYHYDENNKIHFIEFLKDIKFESILMEAMLIAKTANGEVRFTINEIPFVINEETALDKLIIENGITLVDSCTYSNKIGELISAYNDELLKREKQRELVYVLKQIRDKKNL